MTSCSASAACSVSSAPACSSSRRPARSARTSRHPNARWSGCASCRRAIGRPITFALTQNDHDPDSWSRMLELCAEAAADGAQVTPQVAGRPVSLLLGLADVPPVRVLPVVGADRRGAARARRSRRCATPRCAGACSPRSMPRSRRCGSSSIPSAPSRSAACPTTSRRGRAALPVSPGRRAAREMEVFYDVLMEDDGHKLVMRPLLNYSGFSLDPVRDDALASHHRVGPRRRRRALRHDLRREHADVHAHPLGA